MDDKIKKTLDEARAAMRRISTAKKTDIPTTAGRVETLSERIAREAEEKAREALYAEDYRRRITEASAEEVAPASPAEEAKEAECADEAGEPSVEEKTPEEPTRVTKIDPEVATVEPETAKEEADVAIAEPTDEEISAEPEEAEVAECAEREEAAKAIPEPKRRLAGFVVIPTGIPSPPAAAAPAPTPRESAAGVPEHTEAEEYAYAPTYYPQLPTDVEYPVDTTDYRSEEYSPDYKEDESYAIPYDEPVTLDGSDAESGEYRPTTETETDGEPYHHHPECDLADTGELESREEGSYHDETYYEYEPEEKYYTAPARESYPELRDLEERPTAKEIDEVCLTPEDVDREKIEENARLVELRMRYEIDKLKREHGILGYTHTLSGAGDERGAKIKKKEINRRLSRLSYAVRCERMQSRMFYAVALDKTEGKSKKRMRSATELESVLRRFEMLLSERDKINARLTELYTGATQDGTEAKASRRYVRAARRSYKAQRSIARQVRRMHAPDDLRERIIALLNERTALRAQLEMTEHKLSRDHYKGAARREARRAVREMRRKIKYIGKDIKHFMKRARRHDVTYRENGKQLGWIFGTLAVLGLLALGYFLFKEQIDLFLSNLFSGGAL